MGNDYIAVLNRELEEFHVLLEQRYAVDLKIAQKEQFIRATMNMLPDSQRIQFTDSLEELENLPVTGLTNSIRAILKKNPKKFHTATEVRNALVKSGFNFAGYSTNPLASVHAALKRLKPEEAETTVLDGVMAWRAKDIRIRRRRRIPVGQGIVASLGMPNHFISAAATKELTMPENEKRAYNEVARFKQRLAKEFGSKDKK